MIKQIKVNSLCVADGKLDSSGIYEDMNQHRKRNLLSVNSDSGKEKRIYRLVIVGLALLCVLLFVAIIVMWVYFGNEQKRLHTMHDALQEKIEKCDDAGKTQGWRCFNSKMYHISTEKKNWSDGRLDCLQRGADLVTIKRPEVQEFIDSLRSGREIWIGLNDTETEGVWKWVDGTSLTIGNWQSDQPNNGGWRRNQNCVINEGNPDNRWNDKTCTKLYYWICEKPICDV